MSLPPLLRHPARALVRLIWLGAELGLAALHFPFRVLLRRDRGSWGHRCAWLQCHCRRVLRVLHVETRLEGTIPGTGLLACNHLSYVDILALGALAPMVFVAKKDVRGWPIFGGLARLGGTIFVHREKVREVSISTRQIEEALQAGVLVTLFPEGTSSDGREVLPFKPTLLAAAQSRAHPIHAGCIHYPPENGNVADEICYWRDMTLVPHLLNLLARPAIVVRVGFTELRQPSGDRKELARQLHAEVERWRRSWSLPGLPPTLIHQSALSPHPEAP